MKISHSSQVKLPDIGLITDPNTKRVMDQFMKLIHTSFKNIFDDITMLSGKKRHTIDSTTALTLSDGGVYVFTGTSAATWTLPDLSREPEKSYFIKNRGSETVTLTRAGSDEIYDTSAVTTFDIVAGSSYLITNDGTYWIVFDLN